MVITKPVTGRTSTCSAGLRTTRRLIGLGSHTEKEVFQHSHSSDPVPVHTVHIIHSNILPYWIYCDSSNCCRDEARADLNSLDEKMWAWLEWSDVELLRSILLFLDTQSWQGSEKDNCTAEIKSKKGDPRTWAVPGQFGPDKAQIWVSEPAAQGENSILHPPEVLPTQEVSPAFWPNFHNKVKLQARSLSQQHVWERWGGEHKG